MKLVALAGETKYPAGMNMMRAWLALVLLLCGAIILAAPSSARSLHLVDHVAAPVAAGEFHSHDEHDGHDDASTRDHDVPSTPVGDGQEKSGHSHMPSSVSDLSQLPEPQAVIRHLVSDDPHAMADLPSLANRGSSPPVRPPRAA